MTAHAQPAASAADTTLSLLDDLLAGLQPRDFAVRLWDGRTWGPEAGPSPRVTLVLRHPSALRQLLLKPTELNFAERYLHDDIDVEGDVEALLPIGRHLAEHDRSLWDRLRIGLRALSLPADGRAQGDGNGRGGLRPATLSGIRHSLERDRQAVTHHYDVSNDFFRLFLDRNLIYSCAYFADADEDLDRAQERKLDLLCRKLRLRPGERLLDIGCGWGGLILHAARHYGVDATGITLSQPQAEWVTARIREAGLAAGCRAEVRDYRLLDRPEGYDKIVSVGMVEHVGRDRLPEYFATVFRLLKPGGAFLNHGIGDLPGRPTKSQRGFIRTYVFPDSDLPPIADILRAAEECQFEARDLESLREHYAMTLRQWVRRLEANRAAAVAGVGEPTYRMWRLYMAGCAYWFQRGWISVYQSLFVKRDAAGRSRVPLTRADWYQPRPFEVALA